MATLFREEPKPVATQGKDPLWRSSCLPDQTPPSSRPNQNRKLSKQAEAQLVAEGLRCTDAPALVTPVAALLEDATFWDTMPTVSPSSALRRFSPLPWLYKTDGPRGE